MRMSTDTAKLETPAPSAVQFLLQLEFLLPLKRSPLNGKQAEKENFIESSRKRRRAEEVAPSCPL